jgi:hypothetical protein
VEDEGPKKSGSEYELEANEGCEEEEVNKCNTLFFTKE